MLRVAFDCKQMAMAFVAQHFAFATFLCHQCFATFAAAAAIFIFADKLATLRHLQSATIMGVKGMTPPLFFTMLRSHQALAIREMIQSKMLQRLSTSIAAVSRFAFVKARSTSESSQKRRCGFLIEFERVAAEDWRADFAFRLSSVTRMLSTVKQAS